MRDFFSKPTIILLILIGIFLIFSSLLFASAQTNPSLTLELNQSTFKPAQTLKATAKLHNTSDQEVQATLLAILSYSEQEKFPVMPFNKEITLQPNEKKEIELYSLIVREDFPSGEYSIGVELRNRDTMEKLAEDSATFTITDTLKEMELTINICKDEKCAQKPQTILKNETIYLSHTTDISQPTIQANLTYPDKTKKSINLPTSITVDQTGTYVFQVTASKPNYKTATQQIQFGVIEKQAVIPSKQICNGNTKCESERGENYQNCPQDCFSPEIQQLIQKERTRNISFAITIIFLLLVLGAVYYIYLKRKGIVG